MLKSGSGDGCLPRTTEQRTEKWSRSGEQNGVVEIRLGITYERENRAGERWRDVWPESWDSAV